MAKFRSNHAKQGAKGGGTTAVRVGLFGAIIAGLFFAFSKFIGGEDGNTDDSYFPSEENTNYADAYFLPSSSKGQLVEHEYYWLSYVEEHEQAEWVAYTLTREQIEQKWVERPDLFLPDPAIRSQSATPDDYYRSGYDRGHLVPAADRAFSKEAIEETFLMSNISPQAHSFNGGIWRELEELTRSWAKKYKKLYVVTGPVFSMPAKGRIGDNEVTIPAAYFKVILDASEPELKGIGFIMPNEISYEPVFKYATSIDEIERLTGLNFFNDLLDRELEEELESSYNIDLWQFNKAKFEKRINKWNNN
ncbi:MAG: DNA/RNA non-specific endonuclease [Bacteroidota bacterium]